MSALDNLALIDRTIGYPKERTAAITNLLHELDKDGVSLKDGYGSAPKPSFVAEKAAPLDGSTSAKTPFGVDLILFYTTECPFSNYHHAPMTVDGKDFLSSEQFFMWVKAKTFKDEETAEDILSAGSPAEARKLGRMVRNFKDEVWKETSLRIMTVACYRKFQQNPGLRSALFSTAGAVLVEAAPRDRIWGIGIGASNVNAKDPARWRGSNNLGRILTVIREHMVSSKVYAMLPIPLEFSIVFFLELLGCSLYLVFLYLLYNGKEVFLHSPFFHLFYSTGEHNKRDFKFRLLLQE
ncbi:hypothetical protein PMAYCL1PPCAC_33470 [Pristionchus mayeri]|uniref:NADAR domain-containing protein n=1 Tax=Pristionchus mayeri TaxID=1317129 RepID=A0AAN5DHS8_9BILA|nr:hypothetical protein PMAYCL1PPCAC_17610 [Pristionchus mayeri]GMR63275.1 hypothetical protein PMAYCL1PPCAC_33470 [Pristionchus mayeri]